MDGQAIVELCNASTEEFWVTRGTVVVSASVVPKSALASESKTDDVSKCFVTSEEGETVATARSETTAVNLGEKVMAAKPDVPPDKGSGMKADARSLG
ncbi:unnamed protein product [Phytophthora fragariaefolia]|uniref:Unnamed protein product n=1 Tax=Phytophthora fragariaefolia TaxID=1490495 RepID=A0A9W6XBB9_9STRA|nr:unnamed protein product [Phytophthora fragariaefolia]